VKASDLFVRALENEGVDRIFAVPGEENLDVVESLRTSSIELVLVRHEQSAAFMAATHGRLTGRPGVCMATLGPGALNLVTGAAYAHLGAMPMILITGQKAIMSARQARFQIVDIVATMKPLTKSSRQIISAASIPTVVRDAFRLASEERPGPVHLELPEDIAGEQLDREVPLVRAHPIEIPVAHPNALDRSNGQRFWRVNVGLVSTPLALVDRVLLVANQRGEFLGLNPKSGVRYWRRQTGVASIAPIPLDSGVVLLTTPDSLFRIATGDGAVRRRVRAPGPVVSPWIRMRDALVAGTADSLVLAIDPDSLTTRWKVRLDAPVMDSPAVAGDTVYAATRRGTLYRVLPGTPARAERIVELDWPITAPVTIVHGLILLGGADGTIRALEPNGTERWRITLWRPIELGPLPLDDGMVVVGGKGDLHRYRR